MTTHRTFPLTSVVVASISAPAVLERCLHRLVGEVPPDAGEIILVRNADDAIKVTEIVARRFPDFRLLSAPAESSVFEQRALGVSAARGEVVMLLEDHCLVEPGWWEALRGAVDRGTFAGGSMIPALPASRRRFALYCVEYAALLPGDAHVDSIKRPVVCGANAAYPRRALEECRDVWEGGFREDEVQQRLESLGFLPVRCREALVCCEFDLSRMQAVRHLFAGGRHYGGRLRQEHSLPFRLARAAAMPLVVLVLCARIVRAVLRRRRSAFARLLAASPWVATYSAAWAGGEALGVLIGGRAVMTDSKPSTGSAGPCDEPIAIPLSTEGSHAYRH